MQETTNKEFIWDLKNCIRERQTQVKLSVLGKRKSQGLLNTKSQSCLVGTDSDVSQEVSLLKESRIILR